MFMIPLLFLREYGPPSSFQVYLIHLVFFFFEHILLLLQVFLFLYLHLDLSLWHGLRLFLFLLLLLCGFPLSPSPSPEITPAQLSPATESVFRMRVFGRTSLEMRTLCRGDQERVLAVCFCFLFVKYHRKCVL